MANKPIQTNDAFEKVEAHLTGLVERVFAQAYLDLNKKKVQALELARVEANQAAVSVLQNVADAGITVSLRIPPGRKFQ